MLDEVRWLFSINTPLSDSRIRQIPLYVIFSVVPILYSGDIADATILFIFWWTFPSDLLSLNIISWIFLLRHLFRELLLTTHKVLLYQHVIVDPGLRVVDTICSMLLEFRQSVSLAKNKTIKLRPAFGTQRIVIYWSHCKCQWVELLSSWSQKV